MGNSFGRQVLTPVLGNDLMALATLDDAGWKPGGVTVDWATVTAVSSSPVTLLDKNVVAVGQKALRYGQVLTLITNGTVQTVTITGGPTGGTFTLGVNIGGVQTTSAIAYNAAASAVQAALQALSNVGTGNATATGSAGGPYTVSFVGSLLGTVVPQMGHTDSLTGGTTPAVVVAVTNAGNTQASSAYGPYDSAATDGRATLTRGAAYILNQTVLEFGVLPGLPTQATNHPPGVFEAGYVWKARLIIGSQAHELGAAGPSVSAFEAVFPGIRYAQ